MLTCCNSANQDTITDNVQEATQEIAPEIKDYPDKIDTEEGKLLTPLLADELFTSNAEENNLDGTLYQIYGTVTEYIYDEVHSHIEAYRISTHKGEIVVGDPCHDIISGEVFDDLGSIDEAALRSYLPILPKGVFLRVFAEYQGTSYQYGCPFFIYGGTDYLAEAVVASMVIAEDLTAENTEPTEAPQPTATQYSAGTYKVGVGLPTGEYLFFANDQYSAYVCASTDSVQDDILENENFT